MVYLELFGKNNSEFPYRYLLCEEKLEDGINIKDCLFKGNDKEELSIWMDAVGFALDYGTGGNVGMRSYDGKWIARWIVPSVGLSAEEMEEIRLYRKIVGMLSAK